MAVGEIELCNKVKLELLPKIVGIIQMLHYHKIKIYEQLAAPILAESLRRW